MKLRRFLTCAAALGAIGMLVPFAAQPARAGITLTALAGATPIAPGTVSGISAFPGVDPVTDPQSLGLYEIDLNAPAGTYTVGANQIKFNTLTMSQTYDPNTGPLGSIFSALGDTTTVTLQNLSGPAVTITLSVVYDAFNYPTTNPLIWTSVIAATRLDHGATYGSTESLSSGGGPITHTTLTVPGSETLVSSVSPSRPFALTQTLSIFLPTGAIASFEKSDTLSATPEPSTMAIAGLGALGMLFYARKRRSR